MTATLSINGQSLRDAFQAWHAERDAIDSQLSESLAALAAYQSHLDDWQQRLVRERDELAAARQQFEQERDQLRGERNQLDHDRAAIDTGQSEDSTAVIAELNAARDKISALTASLLNRTEELRTLDERRSEAATEAELARAREKEIKSALDEQKRAAEEERAHWKEELRQLREQLARCAEAPAAVERTAPAQPIAPVQPQPATCGAPVTSRQNPVLGSIVQQFDKLRQQRASDRHAANKPK